MENKNTYIKGQPNILSSIGLFYMIIVTLFAIPLVGTFVIVIIQGVVDFKYAIIFGIGLLCIIAVFYLVKFFKATINKISGNSLTVIQGIQNKGSYGSPPVQVSILNGLISFTYRKDNPNNNNNDVNNILTLRQRDLQTEPVLLPYAKENQNTDMISRLKELSKLKKEGVINEDEFQIIKKNLIEDSIAFRD